MLDETYSTVLERKKASCIDSRNKKQIISSVEALNENEVIEE